MTGDEPKLENLLARSWPVLLIGGVWLWIFWPIMTGQQVVGFRDSAYLYYPLFKWIDAQWAIGEIPLWNPYCNFGMPVVADGSSSVFYPGKLIFFCWFLSYPARYGIYLAIHIPLAAAGSYWFARTLRANRAGATLAAFSFAFGGSVLFQVTNVIFLVSAAWLPFALCCVWKMIKTGQLRWAIGAGVCCALMILGGDPQMVYHVGLIAVATVFVEFVWRVRQKSKANLKRAPEFFWLLNAGLRICVMVLVTSSLAAIQLLPTYYWSQLSERTHPEVPANVYQAWDVAKEVGGIEQISDALLGDPVGTVYHSYQFSQPPWSIPELLWPNISGKPFPTHQRWASGLAGADRIWVPSLYVGFVTVLLGILGFRFWGRRRKQVWLTYLFFFFMLGSFGWYGLVWLFIEIYPPLGLNTQVGPQVGGLYWLMNMVLPQYFAFRYSAKLFVVASLALSVLAGVNFRHLRLKRSLCLCISLVAITGGGLIGFNALVQSLMSDTLVDPMFGPFDLLGATNSLRGVLIHSLVVGGCMFILCLTFGLLKKQKTLSEFVMILVVVVAACDIAIANRWLVPLIEVSVFESPNPVQKQLAELRAELDGAEPLRVFRSPIEYFEPVSWQQQSSENRLAEVVQWRRETLFPKHHLGENVVLLGSFSSIWPADYQEFVDLFDTYRAGGVQTRWRKQTVLEIFHGSLERVDDGKTMFQKFNPKDSYGSELPIDWMFEFDPETETVGTREWRCFWREVSMSFIRKRYTQDCEIIEFENNRFLAQVWTDRPKVLAFFAPVDHGWKVKVRDLETDEMQSPKLIELDDWYLGKRPQFPNTFLLQFPKSGKFEVEFVYSPREFWVGAWISGCSWLVLIFGFAVNTVRKRKI